MIRYPEPRHFLLVAGRTQLDDRYVRERRWASTGEHI
jgi:hypothetical protein